MILTYITLLSLIMYCTISSEEELIVIHSPIKIANEYYTDLFFD